MAVIEQAIYSLLNTKGVTDLVPLASITPDVRKKDGTLPAIVYRIGYGEPIKTLAGPHASLTRTDVTVTAYATTRLACRNILNACGVVFDGYSGETGGVVIRGLTLDTFETAYFEPIAGENQGVYAAALTIRVMHETL